MSSVVFLCGIIVGMQCVDGPAVVEDDPAVDNPSWDHIPELTATSFDDSVTVEGRFSMIEFYLPGCGSCEEMKEPVGNLYARYSDSAFFGKVDKGKYTALADKYGASVPPSFVFLKSGEPYDLKPGTPSEQTLATVIEKGIAATKSGD